MVQAMRTSTGRIWEYLPRILLGLLFFISGTLKLAVPFEAISPAYGAGEPFMTSLQDTGYLFILLTLTEIVAGLLLLSNHFVPLALTLLAPIIVNIVFFHLFINPSVRGFVATFLVVGLELFLVSRYHRVFAPFFQERFER